MSSTKRLARRAPRTSPKLRCELLEDRSLFDVGLGGLARQHLAGAVASAADLRDGIPLSPTSPDAGKPGADRPAVRQQGGVADGSVLMSWLGEDRRVAPGRWVVRVGGAAGAGPAALDDALAGTGTGVRVGGSLGRGGWFRVTAPASYSAEAVAAAVGRVAPVASLSPEFADYAALSIPNDPFFRFQDSLGNTGANGGLPDADIDAPEAWGHTGPDRGSATVVVAVNDTGVDYTHPDLYRNIWLNQAEIPSFVTATDTDGDGLITFWDLNDPANAGVVADNNGTGYIDAGDILRPVADGGWMDGTDAGANGFIDDLIGWDFANGDNDPFDNFFHGTATAGIVGATGDDGTGIAGVVWKTQLMALNGLGDFGFGTDFDLAAAITYAVDNGARITNASWGGEYSPLIDDAVVYAGTSDHLVVVAAGNEFNDNDAFPDFSFPAALPYDNVLSVGSTDVFDAPSFFTNYGATSVDLMAPGDFILSTAPTYYFGFAEGYEFFGGTSEAAPHVAGAAALLWATDPAASLAAIRAAILDGVDLLPDLDPVTGFTPVASGGRLNLLGALRQLHADDLFVLATTPADGETATGPQPTQYTVTFNAPVQIAADPLDLQAGDFSVNGVPATGVTLSADGLTATFTFATLPLATEGLQSLAVAPGSVRRTDTGGTLPAGYEGTFRYDSVPLAVTGVNPAPGSVFTAGGPYTFRLSFNEAITPDSLDEAVTGFRLYLLDFGNGFGYVPSSATLVLGNTALDLTFAPPASANREGTLQLVLDAFALTDQYGNPNPDQFFAQYTTDIGTAAYPVPLTARPPLGSLVATGATASGLVNPGIPGGDRDNFTLNVDAGQALTVDLAPAAGLRPRVEVFNAANVLVAGIDAPAAGRRALLQSAPAATGGVYTIRVSGVGGTTGNYSFTAHLNTNLEEEGRVTGATNNTPAAAQPVGTSFIGLGTDLAKAARGAVVGAADGVQSYAAAASASAFEDISASPGATAGFDEPFDDGAFSIPLPAGDSFTFYGTAYTTLFASSNGLITFGSANASFTNSNLATSPAQAAIAPLWADYVLNGDATSNVFWEVRGTGATRRLIVQWNEIEYFPGGMPSALTFQAVLNLADGSVTFHYADLDAGDPDLNEGAFGTVGVKGANPNANPLLVSFNAAGGLVGTGKAVAVTPLAAPVVRYDYYSFTANAGERVGLALTGLAAGLPEFGLDLIAPDGTTVLGTGGGGAENVAKALGGVTVGATGTYFARVGGGAGAGYSLVLTRDVVFGLEPNNSAATAQPLAGAKGALGYVEAPPAVTALDSGWYDSTGFHSPTNTNYLVGQPPDGGGQVYRNWFVFDVPVLAGAIQSARVELFNPSGGFASPDGTETYALYDVTTPVATLRAGGAGLTGVYADLGGGVSYGSVTVTPASDGQLVVVTLNAAGVAAVAAAQGGPFAVGGAITTVVGPGGQSLFGFSNGGLVRQLVITTATPPSDWYAVTLAGDQTALQVETRTPGDGAGEIRNTLNPRVEVYNAAGTTLIASGTALADGRNEKLLVTGLTPGATYQVRVLGEGGTVGEYFVAATPLRVPTITSKVDDGLPNTWGPDGGFNVPNPAKNGWTNVTGAGWQNDYTVHQFGVSHTPNNAGTWNIRATSANPELFVTWVPRPTNATNATYEVYRGGSLLATVVVNQRELPNDGLLFGNTYVESLGRFSGIPVNSFLTVKLLTVGANGDVVADGVFDPPTEPDPPAADPLAVTGQPPAVAVLPLPLPQPISRPLPGVWFGPGGAGSTIAAEPSPAADPPREAAERPASDDFAGVVLDGDADATAGATPPAADDSADEPFVLFGVELDANIPV